MVTTDALGLQRFEGRSSVSGAGLGNKMLGPAASGETLAGEVNELLVARCAGAGSSRGITSWCEDDDFLVLLCAGVESSRGITACSKAFGFLRRTGVGADVLRSGFAAERSGMSGFGRVPAD